MDQDRPERGPENELKAMLYAEQSRPRRCWQWVARFNGPANASEDASAIASAGTARKLFVTGSSGEDYGTVAYSPNSGSQLWVAVYDGAGVDSALAVAVSPDGSQVFVTGVIDVLSSADYATVAYNADTGDQLWAARYNGPPSRAGPGGPNPGRDGRRHGGFRPRRADDHVGAPFVPLEHEGLSYVRPPLS